MTAHRAPAGYFPAEGYRIYGTGAMTNVSTSGYRWFSSASAVNAVEAYCFYVNATGVNPSHDTYRAQGFPVRCLQAFTLAKENPDHIGRGFL